MAEKTMLQRYGLTPVKSGMIAVLSIVLVAVVWGQFGGTDQKERSVEAKSDAPRSPARRNSARPASRSTKIAAVAELSPRTVPAKAWSRISVEESIQFNPFQLPGSLAGASPEATEAERNDLARHSQEQNDVEEQRRALRISLLNEGVSMVVVGPHGKSAYLGNQLIREGDMVHGFIVKEIGPNGVVLIDPGNM